MSAEFDVEALKAEMQRLREKQAASNDEDIQLALQGRIDHLEAELHRHLHPVVSREVDSAADIPETAPEALAEAERLVRDARVLRMRSDTRGAQELMKRAGDIAPHSPAVLEAIGDDLAERRQINEAVKVYGRAIRLDPTNVGLERKHAGLVLQMSSLGSIEDQLRANLSDSPFLTSQDDVASRKAAVMMNVLLPGMGQFVTGQTRQGAILMGTYVVCFIGVIVMQEDVKALLLSLTGRGGHPNLLVVLPLFAGFVVWLIGLKTVKGQSAPKAVGALSGARPRPPVDLPFE